MRNNIDFQLMFFGEVPFHTLDCPCCCETFYYAYSLITLSNKERLVNFYFNLFYYINRATTKILNKCALVWWTNNKKDNHL